MADGIELNAASGGATLLTDDTGAGGHAQVVKLAIASDGSATLIPADNTNGLLVDVARVQGTVTVAAHAVTNAGTFAVQVDGAALTALQIIDNPVLVDDAAFTPGTSSVMMAGFEFDDTTPDSVNEGDAGAARMSGNRNQYIQIRDGAGNERGANVDASNRLTVSVDNTVTVASHAVTNAGTFAVQVDGAALTSLQLLDDVVVVDGASVLTKGFQIAGSDGTLGQIISVTSGGHVHIHDGGNSITVDVAGGATGTLANVAASTSSVTLQAANAARVGWIVHNDSDKTMWLKFGTAASSTSYTVEVIAQQHWEMPLPAYTGIITGVWDTGPTGSARVTEW